MRNVLLNLDVKSLAFLGLMLCINPVPLLAQPENPHDITDKTDLTGCDKCHATPKAPVSVSRLETKNHSADMASFTADGIEMCSGCHNPDDGHKVKLKLDFQVPADLPLGKKNTITCLTCHYTHGNLSSDRPQASFSFMDRLVDAERLHKSYLLRRNNSDGELCLICHTTTNEGAK